MNFTKSNNSLIDNKAFDQYRNVGINILNGSFNPLLEDYLKKCEKLYCQSYEGDIRDLNFKGLKYHDELLTIILDFENKINLGLEFGVDHKNLYNSINIERNKALKIVKKILEM